MSATGRSVIQNAGVDGAMSDWAYFMYACVVATTVPLAESLHNTSAVSQTCASGGAKRLESSRTCQPINQSNGGYANLLYTQRSSTSQPSLTVSN